MRRFFRIKQANSFDKYSAYIFLLVIAFGTHEINAQTNDQSIGEIRRVYREINARISEAEKNFVESDIFLTELNVNKGGTMYPAVGIFNETVRFYYAYGMREKNPYPDRLLKITVSAQRSARKESAEFLFNRSGQLVFYFGKTGDDENRLYFAAEKLIRWQTGEKIENENSREAQELAKQVLSKKDRLTLIFRNSLG